MSEYVSNSMTNKYPCSIYKYTFEMLENNLFGLGYIMFNFEDKHIQERDVILYESPNECKLNLKMPWREFMTATNLEAEKSTHKKETSQDILSNLEKGISYNDIIQVERYMHDGQTNRITDMLKPIMGRVLFDKELIMHSYSELIPKSEFESHIQSTMQPQGTEEPSSAEDESPPSIEVEGKATDEGADFFKLNEGAVLVNCYPVLAPISGTPVFNLKTGDKIMVRVVDDKHSPKVMQSLEVESGEEVAPVSATIRKVQLKDKSFQILVHLKNEYYGRITESEQIKIRTATTPGPDTGLFESPTEKVESRPLRPLVLGIALAIMLIGLVILIVMNT